MSLFRTVLRTTHKVANCSARQLHVRPSVAWSAPHSAAAAGRSSSRTVFSSSSDGLYPDATPCAKWGAGGAGGDGGGGGEGGAELEELQAKAQSLKEKLQRELANSENVRTIARRDVETAKNFGARKFAVSMLEVADNLQMGMDVVPENMRDGTATGAAAGEQAIALLKSLYEGVDVTKSAMASSLKRHDVEEFESLGQPLDPNRHDIKFGSAAGTPGTEGKEVNDVFHVLRPGYMMGDKVLRAAEVGVVQ